ncbi:MAG: saccharopine dehydrogenase family protein, partial [Chitinophagales bacterium]
MVLPGVGFDVVPTDCMAAYLKKALPTATHLTLGFLGLGGISHGTATTMLENLGEPSLIRQKGKIVEIPSGSKTRMIPFNKKPRISVAIPWGDVSTAYHSTGIPNIEVYMGASKNVVNFLQFSENFKWLVTTSMIKNLIQSGIDATIKGPDAKKRRTGKSYIFGEVKDAEGSLVSARIITPEGYTLTTQTAIAAVEKVLKGNAPIGFQTPSSAYGHNFILEMP